MSKTQSGYRVTVKLFVPCDMNDPDSVIETGTILKALPESVRTVVGGAATIEDIGTRFMQRVGVDDVGSSSDGDVSGD